MLLITVVLLLFLPCAWAEIKELNSAEQVLQAKNQEEAIGIFYYHHVTPSTKLFKSKLYPYFIIFQSFSLCTWKTFVVLNFSMW